GFGPASTPQGCVRQCWQTIGGASPLRWPRSRKSCPGWRCRPTTGWGAPGSAPSTSLRIERQVQSGRKDRGERQPPARGDLILSITDQLADTARSRAAQDMEHYQPIRIGENKPLPDIRKGEHRRLHWKRWVLLGALLAYFFAPLRTNILI